MESRHSAADLVDRLSRAARPTLFDAAARPDLLVSLTLANVMSSSLWTLGRHILDGSQRREPGHLSHHRVVDDIHSYVNRHLFHFSPSRMPELWGVLDLQEQRQQLGAESVDYAVAEIVSYVEHGRSKDAQAAKEDLMAMVASDRFPEYEYSTLDVIAAHRRHLGKSKHKPLGVTCCVDETILVASLAVALGATSVCDILYIGAPVHYTALLRVDGSDCWINGKKEYFSKENWDLMVRRSSGLTVQDAFDIRADTDRLIAAHGSFVFADEASTLSRADVDRALSRMKMFFGADLLQLQSVRPEQVSFRPSPMSRNAVADLEPWGDARSAYRMLSAHPARRVGNVLDAALYTYRDVSVEHPQAYVVAALRGHKVRELAADCSCVDDAWRAMEAIAGGQSIFGDPGRLTLPDEVILFDTGTTWDRAFLLFALCLACPDIAEQTKDQMRVVFTDDDGYVQIGPEWIAADGGRRVAPPSQPWRMSVAGNERP